MIDVSLYLRRLEIAKEWMCHKIDGTLPMVTNKKIDPIVFDVINTAINAPELSFEKVMSLYNQTGVLFWREPVDMHYVSIEEYFEYRKIFNPIK